MNLDLFNRHIAAAQNAVLAAIGMIEQQEEGTIPYPGAMYIIGRLEVSLDILDSTPVLVRGSNGSGDETEGEAISLEGATRVNTRVEEADRS